MQGGVGNVQEIGGDGEAKHLYNLKLEKTRRINEEYLRYYQPHTSQIAAHKSEADIRILHAANQYGKSVWLRSEIAWTVGKVHPYRKNLVGPVYARHCCADFQVMNSVVVPGYRSLLPRKPCLINGMQWPGLFGGEWERAWKSESRTITFADGSLIEFKSYDQDILSYAGPPRHIIGHDEEPPRFLFEENVARQATTGRNLLFAFTPLNYSAWLYQLYIESVTNPKIACFAGSLYDSPYVKREDVEALEKSYEDPAERAARIYGEFTFTEGRVWKEYGEHNLCNPFPVPENWPISVIIDPHPEKATGVLAIAEGPDNKGYAFWEDEIKGDVHYICERIKAGLSGKYVTTFLIDPSSRQSAGIYGKGRLIDEFRIDIPQILEANNDRELGWEAVRKRVKNNPTGGPKLFIFRSCPKTHFQMQNYSWKPPMASGEHRNKPEVVKRSDEYCDCVRYWCMHTRMSHMAGESFGGFEIRTLSNG